MNICFGLWFQFRGNVSCLRFLCVAIIWSGIASAENEYCRTIFTAGCTWIHSVGGIFVSDPSGQLVEWFPKRGELCEAPANGKITERKNLWHNLHLFETLMMFLRWVTTLVLYLSRYGLVAICWMKTWNVGKTGGRKERSFLSTHMCLTPRWSILPGSTGHPGSPLLVYLSRTVSLEYLWPIQHLSGLNQQGGAERQHVPRWHIWDPYHLEVQVPRASQGSSRVSGCALTPPLLLAILLLLLVPVSSSSRHLPC